MKNFLLPFLASALALSVSAQVSVQPNQKLVHQNPTVTAIAPVAKTPIARLADNQRWLGLYTSEALGTVGTGTPDFPGNNKVAAIMEKSLLTSYIGKKVVGIRFGLIEPLASSRVFVAPITLAQYSDETDVVGEDITSQDVATTEKGWNLVMLDKPFVLTDDLGDLLVGFDYEQKNTQTAYGYTDDCYPLSMVMEGPGEQPLMVYCDLPEQYYGTGWAWYRFGAGNTNLSVQLLVEGSFSDYSVTPSDFGQVSAVANTTVNVPVQFYNFCKVPVTDLDYVVTVDGQALDAQHVTLNPAVAEGTTGTFNATVPTGTKDATLNVSIEVTKINGHDNEADDKVAEGTIGVASSSYMRNVVVEEFTTEGCGNCPRTAADLHRALETVDQSRVYAVCHHSAFYTDFLTRQCDKDLTWLFNNNGTFAPALMFNRQPNWEALDDASKPDNVMFPSTYEMIPEAIDEELGLLANAQLQMSVVPNDSGATVVVSGVCNTAYDQASSLLTVYMTEDSVKAQHQSDYRSDAPDEHWHMHVIRYDNGSWGEAVNWQDNAFTATYGIRIDEAWNKGRLKFVAFLNKHNASNKLDNRIENSIGMDYPNPTGIGGVKATDEAGREVARYNAAGQRISGMRPGLNIVKLADGSTMKVMVK